MNTFLSRCALVVTGVTFPLLVEADDIVIDFGSSLSTPGGNVNDCTPADNPFSTYTSGVLKDYSTGNNTGATVSLTGSGGTFWTDWPTTPDTAEVWTGSTTGWMSDSLASDFIGSSDEGASLTITLSGLSAGTYSLSLLSSGVIGSFATGLTSESISVSIGGGSGVNATSEANGGTDLGTGWDTVLDGEGLNDYLIWDNLVVGSGQDVVITITDVSPSDGTALLALNGLRITSPVPEPAETATFLGVLGLLGAWFHRRKKAVTA